MEFIKNADEFYKWLDRNMLTLQIGMSEPTQYPCYVYKVVYHWGAQEEEPVYIYEAEAHEMLARLKSGLTHAEAYKKLCDERPVIAGQLRAWRHRYNYPEAMADAATVRGDGPELAAIILQACYYVMKNEAL